jgi:uncharacterized protein (TIGR03437 family)
LLVLDPDRSLRIIGPNGATIGRFPPGATNQGLDAEGTYAYYTMNNEIRRWSLSTGRQETVYSSSAGAIVSLGFNDDASVIAAHVRLAGDDAEDATSPKYLPILIHSADGGSGAVQTLDDIPPTSGMTFSGDGRVLFTQDPNGRIHRWTRDCETGFFTNAEELHWAPVLERRISGVPGSRISPTIVGFGLNQDFQLKIGGIEAPRYFYRDLVNFRTQVPWELSNLLQAGDSAEVELHPAGGLPSKSALTVEAPKPVFETMYHTDWNSQVLPDNPAAAGELIYVDTLGLGPVDISVSTGERTPLEPVSRPLENLQCQTPSGSVVPMADARLAYNEIGMYRIAFVNPGANSLDRYLRPSFRMDCRIGSDGPSTTLFVPSLPVPSAVKP